ncbi:MAG: UDP-N-acetylmuramoyl-L-alanine--D-glutamate ligase [Myxococcales bacterium]|nr:UDP-N-acetylmuramoyl-L-alanine--D-glutamate ligase [Myxococcales bacterium]
MAPMELRDLEVLVVGLGRSGVAAAELCLAHGARVTVNDSRSADALREPLAVLDGRAQLSLGGHPEARFTAAQLIVLSPGVPPLPALDAARAAGVPIIGEIELAARFVEAPIVAITGTNGKSTTTTLVGAMLDESGLPTFVGGNLGTPLADAVRLGHPAVGVGGRVVLELSSFQLETVAEFRAHVAALLNLSEDHLDRYPDYEAYRAAKARIFERQREIDFAVVNGRDDQAMCRALAARSHAQKLSFAGARGDDEDAPGAFFAHDPQSGTALVLRLPQEEIDERYEASAMRIAGQHNRENALAALLIARVAGATPDACARVLSQFRGLPHRMQRVAAIGDVLFYNDSKATNVGSVVGSIGGFERPVVLIAGGKHKGGDYGPLRDIVAEVCTHVVLIGAAADLIAEALDGSAELHRAPTLEEAVRQAHQLARPGDAVVLSPACSSYDMFSNYEERGARFVEAVRALAVELGESQPS